MTSEILSIFVGVKLSKKIILNEKVDFSYVMKIACTLFDPCCPED